MGCGTTTPDGWLNVDSSYQVTLAQHPLLKKLLVGSRILPKSQAEIQWRRDVLRHDLSKRLPFGDESFGAIYTSHTLEHLYFKDASQLLCECHRVLRAHGVCRVVVPDLASVVDRYLENRRAKELEAANRLMEELLVHEKEKRRGLLGAYYKFTSFHQHKWMYDAGSMMQMFENSGFRDVRECKFCDSRIARITEVEVSSRVENGCGVVVEGVK